MAIHIFTSNKRSVSAVELQRQLGRKRYEPIWAKLQKLRIVMENWNELHVKGFG